MKTLTAARYSLIGVLLSLPVLAIAGPGDAGEWADNIAGQTGSFINLALQFGFLLGVIAFVAGLYFFWQDSKQPGQGHAKKGFIGVIVGSALIAAPFLIDVGTGTMGAGQGGQDHVAPHLQ